MPYDSPLRKPFCGDKAACPADAPRISFGCDVADRELNGGLRADGLHEFYARSRQDIVATISFALLIGQLCQRRDGRTLIWAREVQAARNGGNPYGPGLAALGIDTRKLVLLILPDAKAVLRAALDAARDAAVAAVVDMGLATETPTGTSAPESGCSTCCRWRPPTSGSCSSTPSPSACFHWPRRSPCSR